MKRYVKLKSISESSVRSPLAELVDPTFLLQHASLTLRERVQLYNEQLKLPEAKKAAVYVLRKLYRKHKIKWKKLWVLR